MALMRCPRNVALLVGAAFIFGQVALSQQPPDPSLADSMAEKLQRILVQSQQPDSEPGDIEISDEEFNAFIVHRMKHRLPEGVVNPRVRFTEGLGWAEAELDLDILRARMPESSMAQLLSGRVPVVLSARLKAEGGKGQLTLETVTLGGFPLPSSFVQELVTANTKSPERPDGIKLDEPFALPYGIDSVSILEGRLLLHYRPVAGK